MPRNKVKHLKKKTVYWWSNSPRRRYSEWCFAGLRWLSIFHYSTECQNYQTLTGADRNVNYSVTSKTCDNGLSGWYRFQGAAGTRMLTWCPSANGCNTHIQGWLADGHPTVAEGNATKQVRFRWKGNCGYFSINIQVRNCSSFYVYFFNGTPTCHARYCGTGWARKKTWLFSTCVLSVNLNILPKQTRRLK